MRLFFKKKKCLSSVISSIFPLTKLQFWMAFIFECSWASWLFFFILKIHDSIFVDIWWFCSTCFSRVSNTFNFKVLYLLNRMAQQILNLWLILHETKDNVGWLVFFLPQHNCCLVAHHSSSLTLTSTSPVLHKCHGVNHKHAQLYCHYTWKDVKQKVSQLWSAQKSFLLA